MGCGSNTTTTTSGPSPQVSAAYQQTLDRATRVGDQPLRQYTGSLIAGFTPDQLTGFGTVRDNQGIWAPYYQQASNYLQSSALPIQPLTFSDTAVDALMNPYIDNVVDKTRDYFNEQNAQQANLTASGATARNAYGGDRESVAQALKAGQQELVQAPIIAGLYSSGYDKALDQFNQLDRSNLAAQTSTGWLQQGAGQNFGTLGRAAQASSLSDANSLLYTGGLQQSLEQAQLNLPYQMFLQQEAYPFQTTGWLGNLALGIGSSSGGTSSTTSPGPSLTSQLGGLATTGLGVYGLGKDLGWWGPDSPGYTGGSFASGPIDISYTPDGFIDVGGGGYFHRGGRIGYAAGGMPFPDALPDSPFGGYDPVDSGIPDVSVSIVPLGSAGRRGLIGSPLEPVVETTQKTGGGGLLGAIGSIGGAILGNTIAPGIGGFVGGRLGGMTGNAIGRAFRDGGRIGLAEGGNPVAPIVHQAASLVDIPAYRPSAGVTFDSIRPLHNYAPTFDASGFAGPMAAMRNDDYANRYSSPVPISLPLSGGVIDRAALNPTLAPPAPPAAPPVAPAPLMGAIDPIYDINDIEGTLSETWGDWRGGRVGMASGGVPDDPTAMAPMGGMSGTMAPSLLMLPDLTGGVVPTQRGSYGGGRNTIPTPPSPISAGDPMRQSEMLGRSLGRLGRMVKKTGARGRGDSGGTYGGTDYSDDERAFGGRAGFENGGGAYYGVPTASFNETSRYDQWFGPDLARRAIYYNRLLGLPEPVRRSIIEQPSYEDSGEDMPDYVSRGVFDAWQTEKDAATRDSPRDDALNRQMWRMREFRRGDPVYGGRTGYADGGFADPMPISDTYPNPSIEDARRYGITAVSGDPEPVISDTGIPSNAFDRSVTPFDPDRGARVIRAAERLFDWYPPQPSTPESAFERGIMPFVAPALPRQNNLAATAAVPAPLPDAAGLEPMARRTETNPSPSLVLVPGKTPPTDAPSNTGPAYSSGLTAPAAERDTQAPDLAPVAPPSQREMTIPDPGSPMRGVRSPILDMPSTARGMPAEQALPLVSLYESEGAAQRRGISPYFIGTGGADLTNAPIDSSGFVAWEGIIGPKGRSTAAGKYQITGQTWRDVVNRHFNGFLDWRVPGNQEKVARILYNERGFQPWAPHNPALAARLALGVDVSPTTGSGGDHASPLSAGNGNGAGNGASRVAVPPAAATAERDKGVFDSPWLPLIAAGLGMMASRNPSALGAIGEGGLAGLGAMQEQAEQAAKRDQARETLDWRNRNLALDAARLNQSTELQGRRLAQDAEQHADTLRMRERQFGISEARENRLLDAQRELNLRSSAGTWHMLPTPLPNGNVGFYNDKTSEQKDSGIKAQPKVQAGVSAKDLAEIVSKSMQAGLTLDDALKPFGYTPDQFHAIIRGQNGPAARAPTWAQGAALGEGRVPIYWDGNGWFTEDRRPYKAP